MSARRTASTAAFWIAPVVVVAIGAAFAVNASQRHARRPMAEPIEQASAEPSDVELESFATSSGVGFAEQHPFITLTALAVVVIVLLSAGAVFTIVQLGYALTPMQPVIWFIAWMSGLGPPWRT